MARQKAEAKVKGRAARRAGRESREAAQRAVELRAAELAARVRESEPVTKAQALTADLAGRVRESEAVARAAALSSDIVEKVREANLDERASELAERATELAERARTVVREANLDERAAELAARVRESEAGKRAAETARRTSDESLERVGTWITTSKAGEKLGVVAAGSRRRRIPVWLGLLLGAVAGYAAAKLAGRSSGGGEVSADPFAEAADRLGTTAAPTSAAPTSVAPPVEPPSGPAPSGIPSVPPAGVGAPEQIVSTANPAATTPLADEIRSTLDADPRTAGLPGLAINVADSTVFVRGSVPAGFDESSIREVVAGVPGVTDVDLQVTSA